MKSNFLLMKKYNFPIILSRGGTTLIIYCNILQLKIGSKIEGHQHRLLRSGGSWCALNRVGRLLVRPLGFIVFKVAKVVYNSNT